MDTRFEIFERIAYEKGCDIALPIKEHFLIQVIGEFFRRFYDENHKLILEAGQVWFVHTMN